MAIRNPDDLTRPARIKGRGAASNREGRFEASRKTVEDDGWYHDETPGRRPDTQVAIERARSIISRNASPDIPFNQSINPYRGCEHGCNYCFARPSHAYLNLSPGLDFETRLFAKTNAAERPGAELAKTGLCLRSDHARRQHRCLPAIERDYRLPRDRRGAACLPASADHRHQERPGRT